MDLKELRKLIKEAWDGAEEKNPLLESPEVLMERLDGQYLFKALFVLGPAGSGKTYLIKNKLNLMDWLKLF